MSDEFRYNMRSVTNIFNRVAAKYFYPIVGMLLVASGLFLLYCIISLGYPQSNIIVYAVFTVVSFSMGLFLFWLGKTVYRFESRRFRLSTDAIEVQDFSYAIYLWNDIFDVAVMYFGATASRQRYYTVICCFINQPEKNYKKRMLDWFYGVRNTDGIVIIEYSDEIMNEFLAKYPRKIFDYRAEQIA